MQEIEKITQSNKNNRKNTTVQDIVEIDRKEQLIEGQIMKRKNRSKKKKEHKKEKQYEENNNNSIIKLRNITNRNKAFKR